jgi:hypothetical protein
VNSRIPRGRDAVRPKPGVSVPRCGTPAHWTVSGPVNRLDSSGWPDPPPDGGKRGARLRDAFNQSGARTADGVRRCRCLSSVASSPGGGRIAELWPLRRLAPLGSPPPSNQRKASRLPRQAVRREASVAARQRGEGYAPGPAVPGFAFSKGVGEQRAAPAHSRRAGPAKPP